MRLYLFALMCVAPLAHGAPCVRQTFARAQAQAVYGVPGYTPQVVYTVDPRVQQAGVEAYQFQRSPYMDELMQLRGWKAGAIDMAQRFNAAPQVGPYVYEPAPQVAEPQVAEPVQPQPVQPLQPQAATLPQPLPNRNVRYPILAARCFSCHGGLKPDGDFPINNDIDFRAAENWKAFKKVLTVTYNGHMPLTADKKAPAPLSDEDFDKLLFEFLHDD